MSKVVVLAEKPSVGRDLARVLGCTQGGNGYLEGPKYIVTWALGHLVTLADPEAYGASNKSWRLEELPIMPKELELVVIKQTARQYSVVKEQLRRKDVSEIVIATDAGREGELVARWILAKAAVQKPIKRLWISSVTDKAIREGFQQLKPGRDYENLYQSAVARAESDWYVGINATRALTCKFNAQLSCGRVQTPTLAIIAQREAEIKSFIPKEYYGLTAQCVNVKFIWQDKKVGEAHSFDRARMEGLEKSLAGSALVITRVDKTAKKSFAPQLYDLTELQRDANKIFSFSAKETLLIMQKLYETHKILTYPRTDSRHISADIVPTLKDRLRACGVGPYTKLAFQAGKQIKASKHFVDDAKVSDHHAIIPTEQFVNLTALSDKERKIYDLVVKRFIAILYPPFEYEQTTVQAEIGGECFIAKGKNIKSLGWKEVYQGVYEEDGAQSSSGDQTLPELKQADRLKVVKLHLTEGKTMPPAPFNEASLLGAMENPAKYMSGESKELKQTIGETGGLGTVATRADIIEKLFSTFVIEKKGKDIFTTAKGRQLLELVPNELKEPALTAKWEEKLSRIAGGKLEKAIFISDIKNYAKAVVSEIKNSQERFRHDNVTRSKCPECGKFLLEVNGKKGKILVCQDRACGFRKSVSLLTNARCPNCHKKLEMCGEGDGKTFICACGHREKLSAFQKRKDSESGARVSKNEVANYMRTQQKVANEPINTALADALAKLKLK